MGVAPDRTICGGKCCERGEHCCGGACCLPDMFCIDNVCQYPSFGPYTPAPVTVTPPVLKHWFMPIWSFPLQWEVLPRWNELLPVRLRMGALHQLTSLIV